MKSLQKTTKETPNASTLALIVGLLPGLLDQFTGIANLIGMEQNTITLVGLIVGAILYVLNYVINNRK